MPPISFVVRADVVDIRVDKPQATDTFVVDTNAWIWFAYSKATLPVTSPPLQSRHYPQYIKDALIVKAGLFRYALTQAELFHNIERYERELFSPGIRAKEFRHNYPAERANVVSECTIAWNTILSVSSPLDADVNDVVTSRALTWLTTHPLDGYDLYMLDAMQTAGVTKILTDDGDFCTIPRIEMFTANKNVVDATRAQGKLVTR